MLSFYNICLVAVSTHMYYYIYLFKSLIILLIKFKFICKVSGIAVLGSDEGLRRGPMEYGSNLKSSLGHQHRIVRRFRSVIVVTCSYQPPAEMRSKLQRSANLTSRAGPDQFGALGKILPSAPGITTNSTTSVHTFKRKILCVLESFFIFETKQKKSLKNIKTPLKNLMLNCWACLRWKGVCRWP